MQSPFDASKLHEVSEHVFQDGSGGYLLTNPSAIKKMYENFLQVTNTQEVQLSNLGVFPLAKQSLQLLNQSLAYESQTLTIEPILQKSQIPLFASNDRRTVYIPAEGAAVCRYFHDLWAQESGEEDSLKATLAGFAVIASFAGI